MRVLFQTAALLAISSTACMSSNARIDSAESNAAGMEKVPSLAVETVEADAQASAEQPTAEPASEVQPDEIAGTPESKAITPKDGCENLRRDLKLPVFLDDADAFIVEVDQQCKKDSRGRSGLEPLVTAVGVPFSKEAARVTKKGHGNVDWEVVEFKIGMSDSTETQKKIEQSIKKHLGFDVTTSRLAFMPMLIEYWEFEDNNDAGTSNDPRLTVTGGGAKQWNKNAQKQQSFPIRLYGHDSSFSPGPNIYEAKATIQPLGRGVFDLSVKGLKILTPEEIQAVQSRCSSKVKDKSSCAATFDSR